MTRMGKKCQVLAGWPRKSKRRKRSKTPKLQFSLLSKGVLVALRCGHVRNSCAQIGGHHRVAYLERNGA